MARCVLDDPSLSMVVGGGATLYAEQKGFALEDNDKLLTQRTALAYQVCVCVCAGGGVGGGGGVDLDNLVPDSKSRRHG